jgi:uncharacterized protein with beta-barrel porin domain
MRSRRAIAACLRVVLIGFALLGGLTAAGATAPGTFTVLSATPGRDTALVGVGAKVDLSPRAALLLA